MHHSLELVTESQLGDVQMKTPFVNMLQGFEFEGVMRQFLSVNFERTFWCIQIPGNDFLPGHPTYRPEV